MSVLEKIIILLVTVVCLTSAQVCYSRVSSYARNAYYEKQVYYFAGTYGYTVSCGFWGWQRCGRTGYTKKTAYRQVTRYRSQLQYSRTSRCCAGYRGNPPSCSPMCSACRNGGTCIAPNTCRCAGGWTGSTCNTVPTPTVTMMPTGTLQGAIVGSPQDIKCVVTTISGVSLNLVKISWTGPGGESITNNSRLFIRPTTSSGIKYTSILRFTYLMEGDGGTYTCNVMIQNAKKSISLNLATLTVPIPSIIVSAPEDQIVGQSLTLKCDITTVRGVTSRVDIVWSSNGSQLRKATGISANSMTHNSVLYTASYVIGQLSTADEDRTYECMAMINAQSPVTASDSVILNATIPYINITTLPSGSIQEAMVGSPQDIQCIVSTVSGVELSSVMISWMGPGGESITNDSRVTISPTTSSGNNYTGSLQFTYLMEGDEGMYTCRVTILEASNLASLELTNLTMPNASVTVSILNNQTVSQSLLLECNVATVRGITSRVDIVWSSNGSELNTVEGVNDSSVTNDSVLFTETYIIPQLSTVDNNKQYQCDVIIDAESPVTATDSAILHVTVPIPTITTLPSGSIQGTMVGSPQDIQCIVSTVSGVELSSVMINWMGPGGESITNDSRVTISPTTSSGNNYTSSLQFTYLMEGDEGIYTCNVMILESAAAVLVEITKLTIPFPDTVNITPISTQTVSQSLKLECSATTVRGIASRVDIVWSNNGFELKRIEEVNASFTSDSFVTYKDFYDVLQLNTSDDGRVYQCEVIVNTNPSLVANGNFSLDVIVPIPTITTLPSGPIQRAMVGSPQDIQCIVSTVNGVELSSVMISWMGPGGESITNDSRVTISPTTSSGNNYTSSLQFTYLMEGDEGIYTCNVTILETTVKSIVEIFTLTVPTPDIVSLTVITTQTVGQALTLECNATTVRGITSRVDIVWSSNGLELKRIEGANVSFISDSLVTYVDYYNALQLNTSDDGRVFQCKMIVNTSPALMADDNVTLDVIVPIPTITILPSGHIQGAMVGSPQDIQCIVSTVSGVELSSVMISWMGPGGESITNDSRVTISPTTSSGNNYTSSLQFTYLMEGDEGMYTCNVRILEANASLTIELHNLTIPNSINVTVTAPNTQIVGQSLILECYVTTVRGITSRIDIEWSIGNTTLQITEGVNVTSTESDSVIYANIYNIAQASTFDDDRVYQCKVIINTNPELMATDSITLDVTVPEPTLMIFPAGPIEGVTIGSVQAIVCMVSTVSGVELSSVMISWMGPDGSLITNNSRIIVNPVTSFGNNYTSGLHFIYLMEGDEGIYSCNVNILETNQTSSVELGNLTFSNSTSVMVTTLNEQIVGRPLMLECEMSTPRGISSRVDVVWSRDGVEVEHINDVSSNFSSPEVVVYTNIYTIPLLGTYDDGIVYECEVIIYSSPLLKITYNVMLDVTVPLPTVTISPPGPIQGAMVGSPQVLVCIVNTVDGVEPSKVIINWIVSYTNSSRITIEMDKRNLSQNSLHHNTYNSSLQFAYLMEGDEDIYTCRVTILDTVKLQTVAIESLTVPEPAIKVNILNNQIVGQSLTLECSIAIVRGITSRVDIVWSSNSSELKRTEGLNHSSTTNDSVLYTEFYTIPQLSSLDEYRTITCELFVNTLSPVTATDSVALNVTVPYINITILPSGAIQGAMVGSPQDIQCIVSTVSGVELSSVMISWMGPGGESITNDSRVTISPTTSSGNNYTSSLQFTYLMEGDEGMYTCNVMILETGMSNIITINNLTTPAPSVTINTPSNQTVGQSLTLESSITTVRGITSTVDIVWSSNGVEMKRIMGATASFINDNIEVYEDTYYIPLLSTADDGRVIECEIVIMTTPSTVAADNVTLNVTVPTPTIIIPPFTSDSIQGAMVGSPQDIQCIVSTVSGVELSSVVTSWMGPGGESITNDSRVTISPTTSSGNNYTSSLQFTYLMEGDEGMYTCNVMILETNTSQFVEIKNVIVPTPNNISVIPHNFQTVGQSLLLECIVTTVRGITSKMDIVWSSGDVVFKTERNVSINVTTLYSASYTSTYIIPQLNTSDDGRLYTCEVVINTSPAVKDNVSIELDVAVPLPIITMISSSSIQGAMVGSPHDIQCIVSTVSGVELSSVMISWMGPEGESITNDSRVTISPTTSSSNNYTSSLQFIYLMEGDEGMYTCNVVILETNTSDALRIKNLLIPIPNQVYVTAPITQTVGQSLMLRCSVITVRGITSRVDIVWSSNGLDLKTVEANISSITNNSVEYTAYYTIVQLNETDDGRVYQCRAVINASPMVITYDVNITLNATIPSPSVMLKVPDMQTVGQSLSLECIVTTVRGITSTIDIIWRSDGTEIKKMIGLRISSSTSSSILYRDFYNISLLTTAEKGRAYQCEGVINTIPSLTSESSITLDVIVPNPIISIIPHLTFEATVGSPQDIQCIVSTVSGVEFSTVMINWMGPGGDSITNDSRVTISPTTSSSNNYTSSLQFTYLMEGDEGMYTCNVIILETTESSTTEMKLIVPDPVIQVYAPSSQIVSEPLTLECNITTVRGITSRLDIVWSSNGLELRRIEGIHFSLMKNNSMMYMDSYTISQLGTVDEGRAYQCGVIINQAVPITFNSSITLDVTVPGVSIDISQSVEGSVIGLPHTLICTVIVVTGVSPSLVKVDWTGSTSLLELPRVAIFDQTSSRSPHKLKFGRAVTFSPLLGHDVGEYACSVIVTGFNSVGDSKNVTVMANVPTLRVDLSPQIFTGDSGEDPIELVCTTIVTEDVMFARYQFKWTKDNAPVISDRIVVTNNDSVSSFVIQADDTNATLDNGIYLCQVLLTISGEDSFSMKSNNSTVAFKAMIPPVEFVAIEVTTTTSYSAEICWVTSYIIMDKETYSVQYSTDMSLQNRSDVIIEAINEFVFNQKFSVNITGLIPFTTYYYIVQASNSVGNTSTDVMTFTTNQSAPSLAPGNFQAINITSTSITFSWDALVDQANGIIQFYVITCTVKDNIFKVNVSSTYTVKTLDDLRPFTSYTCTLHAVTISDGPLSDPITVTTAEQVPSAPVVKNITAIDTESVQIEWYMPTDTNGMLSVYTISYTVENGSERNFIVPFNKQNVQFYNITGLSPYQLVTVIITATNGAGTSEPSNEVSGRTNEAAPGIVEIVDVVGISDTTSLVIWNPPKQRNGIITGYKVMYSVYENDTDIIIVPLTSDINNFNITDLHAGVPYQVTVVAFTSAGRGLDSYPHTFFTKELIPTKPPENVMYERNDTAISVSWDPLTLFEARGFPIYIVTLMPFTLVQSHTTERSSDDEISVTTNETDIVIDLDPNVGYFLTVAVGTSSGEVATDKIMIPITRDQSNDKDNDEINDENVSSNNITFAVVFPIAILCGIIIVIVIVIAYVIKKRRNKREPNDHIMEMQSSMDNDTIHEKLEKDNITIKSSETITSDDLDPVHVYATVESLPLEQNDKNSSACVKEVIETGLSNPADADQQRAKENDYVIDSSTENTSATT